MKLIQVTDKNDLRYMINVNHIVYMRDDHDTTQIKLINGLEIITCQSYITMAEKIFGTQTIQRDKLLKD